MMSFKSFLEKPFAVFVLAPVGHGFAATTRAADKGEAGQIGLPGGKVEPQEDPIQAAKRESAEEGWALDIIDPKPFHKQIVDGNLVWWFRGSNPKMLKKFKELGRITPFVANRDEIVSSGFGNENLGL